MISISYIINVGLNLVLLFLLLINYLYIVNLEEKGCKCAEHPNKNFIKGFSLFAFIFLLLTMFIPPELFVNVFGSTLAIVFGLVQFIFIIFLIVYFFLVFDYTRYLVNEKCKCSEDLRRDIIMIGSLIEIFIIILFVTTIFILPVMIVTITTALRKITPTENALRYGIANPVEAVKSAPKRLYKAANSVGDLIKETTKDVKKIINNKRGKLINLKKVKK